MTLNPRERKEFNTWLERFKASIAQNSKNPDVAAKFIEEKLLKLEGAIYAGKLAEKTAEHINTLPKDHTFKVAFAKYIVSIEYENHPLKKTAYAQELIATEASTRLQNALHIQELQKADAQYHNLSDEVKMLISSVDQCIISYVSKDSKSGITINTLPEFLDILYAQLEHNTWQAKGYDSAALQKLDNCLGENFKLVDDAIALDGIIYLLDNAIGYLNYVSNG